MKRLLDNHPTIQKLKKVYQLMDELNLSISFHDYGNIVVLDKDNPKHNLLMKDLDNDGPVHELPPQLETKLVFNEAINK